MALGMLQPLNPTSRGLADLSGNEDSLLNVAMKRKEIELDLGKQAALAREAADKQKEAARATLDKLPQTVKLEHTKAYSKLYNTTQQRLGRILQANGGVMPAPGTPAYDEYNALAQNLAQVAANSEQLDTRRAAYLDEFTKNPTLYPNLTKGDIENWGTAEDMLSGSLPDNPLEANFDIAGYAEPFFSKIKPDQIAWAGPAAGGGAQAGSTERVLPEDIKTVAEGIAIDDRFQKAALRQFKNFSPEKQAFITGLAEKNGMTIPAAIALDLGTGLESYTKQERSYTQPSAAESGREDKKASARELLETGFGIVGGSAQGKPFAQATPQMTPEQRAEFTRKYLPELKGRFDVEDKDIITNYNGLNFDTRVDEKGNKSPAKIRGMIRYPDGSTRVAYSTDTEGVKVTVTEKIPKEEFYSKVIRRTAINTPEYDINTLDRIAQDEYNLIEGSGGQIDLPRRGPGFNVPKAGAAINFNVPR